MGVAKENPDGGLTVAWGWRPDLPSNRVSSDSGKALVPKPLESLGAPLDSNPCGAVRDILLAVLFTVLVVPFDPSCPDNEYISWGKGHAFLFRNGQQVGDCDTML